MKSLFALTRKELHGYFGSPAALIFLGIFLALVAFSFFWVSGFYARGLADIRPLFNWMPLLLVFLTAALTMRAWSEEQRSGTLELLLTLPVPRRHAVFAKFLAVMALVALALFLTLPIPVVVSVLGPLDWGPVIGGYLACVLLAAAYAALGLWVSALTDNAIVALLATAVAGGLLYLAGSPLLLGLTQEPWTGLLRGLGSGSRFESIERGVIDLRDLAYYLSLCAFFLLLTIYALDRKRWGQGAGAAVYRRAMTTRVALLGTNLLVINLWLAPLAMLRLDITAGREYSLSPATYDLLGALREPLLIRAYISQQSHPLLDPLRPQVEDMLREYAVAGGGRVSAEVVDPAQNPALEAEANQLYGIQPTPFQVSDRYRASVINAYFDILVRYGDQDIVLNFRDLLQAAPNPEGQPAVRLRNLEYDLTGAIKKVLYGFQSAETVLAAQAQPLKLTLYVTPATLPGELLQAPATIRRVAEDLAQRSGGKLAFEQVDPTAVGAAMTPDTLGRRYGIQPIPTSLSGGDSFYLHLVAESADPANPAVQIIYPQNDMGEPAVRDAITTAILRTATGFLKTVGLWTPPATPTPNLFGQMQPPVQSYNLLRSQLAQAYSVRDVDLTSGEPPAGIDVLLLVAPQNLTDRERFAIDQYLMRGGAAVVLAGNYAIAEDAGTGQLVLQPLQGTLAEQLRHYGVETAPELVLDPQNQPFPTQVMRDANGIQVPEVQAVNYPFFVDVRPEGMNGAAGMTGNLANVALYWSSPVSVTAGVAPTLTATTLLQSSAGAWLRSDPTIQPDFEQYPETGFGVEGPVGVQTLAVAVQGPFSSYFAAKPNPLAADAAGGETAGSEAVDGATTATAAATGAITGTAPLVTPILHAADTARLVVVGSSEFVDDAILQLSSSLVGQQVLNNVQFVQNAVDWSVEDSDLMGLRARGAEARLLRPLTEMSRQFWELLAYVLMLAGLVLTGAAAWVWRRSEKPMALSPRAEFRELAPIG